MQRHMIVSERDNIYLVTDSFLSLHSLAIYDRDYDRERGRGQERDKERDRDREFPKSSSCAMQLMFMVYV